MHSLNIPSPLCHSNRLTDGIMDEKGLDELETASRPTHFGKKKVLILFTPGENFAAVG